MLALHFLECDASLIASHGRGVCVCAGVVSPVPAGLTLHPEAPGGFGGSDPSEAAAAAEVAPIDLPLPAHSAMPMTPVLPLLCVLVLCLMSSTFMAPMLVPRPPKMPVRPSRSSLCYDGASRRSRGARMRYLLLMAYLIHKRKDDREEQSWGTARQARMAAQGEETSEPESSSS